MTQNGDIEFNMDLNASASRAVPKGGMLYGEYLHVSLYLLHSLFAFFLITSSYYTVFILQSFQFKKIFLKFFPNIITLLVCSHVLCEKNFKFF